MVCQSSCTRPPVSPVTHKDNMSEEQSSRGSLVDLPSCSSAHIIKCNKCQKPSFDLWSLEKIFCSSLRLLIYEVGGDGRPTQYDKVLL